MPLTYQQKNRGLLAGTLILAILSYGMAFGPTWEQFQLYRQLQAKSQQMTRIPPSLNALRTQIEHFQSIKQQFSLDTLAKSDPLLDQLSIACAHHGVMLSKLPHSVQSQTNGFVLETRQVRLRGTFLNLLQVIHVLEKSPAVGRVSSAHFQIEENYQNQSVYLYVNLYVQKFGKMATSSQPDADFATKPVGLQRDF